MVAKLLIDYSATERQCSDCLEVLPVSDFIARLRRGRIHSYTFCRMCFNIRHGQPTALRTKQWYIDNPGARKVSQQKKRQKYKDRHCCSWCGIRLKQTHDNRTSQYQRSKCVRCYLKCSLNDTFRILGRPDSLKDDYSWLTTPTGLLDIIGKMSHLIANRYPDALLERKISCKKDRSLAFKISNLYWQPVNESASRKFAGGIKARPIIDGYKFCIGCQQNLPVSQYYVNRKHSTGLYTCCKACKKQPTISRLRQQQLPVAIADTTEARESYNEG
jgi:hypothetical protein